MSSEALDTIDDDFDSATLNHCSCCTVIPPYLLARIADNPNAPSAARTHARNSLIRTRTVIQRRQARINRRISSAHGRGTQGIIPSHILNSMANSSHADSGTRNSARRTLVMSQGLRDRREQNAAALRVAQGGKTATAKRLKRVIYSANNTEILDDQLVRSEGDPASNDQAADECYDGFGAVFKFYSEVLDRNSIDDKGMSLIGTVHFGNNYDNAEWDGAQMLFGDGDGTYITSFTSSLDIIGHELTHGVTENTALLKYLGESGALDESIADVFGSMAKQYHFNQTAAQADWLIGADIFSSLVNGVALRSMKSPGTAHDDPIVGKDEQVATYADVLANPYADDDDDGGVHIYSGVPNRAFYLVATNLGGYSWDRAGKIWYATLLDKRLHPTSNFHEFAKYTCDNAETLYDQNVKSVVQQAWKDVGVDIEGTPQPDPKPDPKPDPIPDPTPGNQSVAGTWSGTKSRSRVECAFNVSGTTVQGWGDITTDGRRSEFTVENGYAGVDGSVRFTAKFQSSSTSNEEYLGRLSSSGNAISGDWENADRADYLRAGWPDSWILHGAFNLTRKS